MVLDQLVDVLNQDNEIVNETSRNLTERRRTNSTTQKV